MDEYHCPSDHDCESTPSDSETVSTSDIDLSDFLGESNEISPGVPLSGRHIVELNILGQYLRKGCSICAEVLNLASCVGESRYGLGNYKLFYYEDCLFILCFWNILQIERPSSNVMVARELILCRLGKDDKMVFEM